MDEAPLFDCKRTTEAVFAMKVLLLYLARFNVFLPRPRFTPKMSDYAEGSGL
jgi:hypothetical protein